MQMRQSCCAYLGLPSFFNANLHARTAYRLPGNVVTTRIGIEETRKNIGDA